MAKVQGGEQDEPTPKPLVWLHGEVKTPPFTPEGRQQRRRSKRETEASTMHAAKRKALQKAGWKIADAADFLEMSDEERQLLDARVELALAIRRQRKARKLSQKELGAKLKTSQPRIAKIERAATDVSLDQLVRAFAAAGGKIVVRVAKGKPTNGQSARRPPKGMLILEAAAPE